MVFTHPGAGTEGLHGIGVFAPFVTADSDLKRLGLADGVPEGRAEYEQLALVRDPPWPSLVFDGLRSGLPGDVVTAIESSGASSRSDRTAVAQMLASVDSVFDVLDRRIAATTVKVVAAMPEKMTAEERLAARRPEAVAPLGMLQLLRESALEKALAPPAVATVTAGAAAAAAQPSTAPARPPCRRPRCRCRAASRTPPARSDRSRRRSPTRKRRSAERSPTARSALVRRWAPATTRRNWARATTSPSSGLATTSRSSEPATTSRSWARTEQTRRRPQQARVGTACGGVRALAGCGHDESVRQVAESLKALEQATADAETVAALGLLGSAAPPALGDLLTGAKTRSQVERAFRTLAEASTDGAPHDATSGVASGLRVRPGRRRPSTSEARRALASASGLNGATLTLL